MTIKICNVNISKDTILDSTMYPSCWVITVFYHCSKIISMGYQIYNRVLQTRKKNGWICKQSIKCTLQFLSTRIKRPCKRHALVRVREELSPWENREQNHEVGIEISAAHIDTAQRQPDFAVQKMVLV